MLKKIVDFVSLKIISPIHWTVLKYIFTGRTYDLTPEQREYARLLVKRGKFLWVSRRDTHLTTYFIITADYLLSLWAWTRAFFRGPRPRFGFWSHAFFNYGETKVVEAVAPGVRMAFFDDAFSCDSVAALVPKNMTENEWAALQMEIADELLAQIGKKYDTLFDIKDEERLSCIELVRLVLKRRVKDYDVIFSDFERMIKTYKNVTPQMLYESPDFKVLWEVRSFKK